MALALWPGQGTAGPCLSPASKSEGCTLRWAPARMTVMAASTAPVLGREDGVLPRGRRGCPLGLPGTLQLLGCASIPVLPHSSRCPSLWAQGLLGPRGTLQGGLRCRVGLSSCHGLIRSHLDPISCRVTVSVRREGGLYRLQSRAEQSPRGDGSGGAAGR